MSGRLIPKDASGVQGPDDEVDRSALAACSLECQFAAIDHLFEHKLRLQFQRPGSKLEADLFILQRQAAASTRKNEVQCAVALSLYAGCDYRRLAFPLQ